MTFSRASTATTTGTTLRCARRSFLSFCATCVSRQRASQGAATDVLAMFHGFPLVRLPAKTPRPLGQAFGMCWGPSGTGKSALVQAAQREFYPPNATVDLSNHEDMSSQIMEDKRIVFIGEGSGGGKAGSDGQMAHGFSITMALQIAEGTDVLGKRCAPPDRAS